MADEVAVKFTGSIEGIQTSVTQIREFLQGLEAPIRGVRAGLGELAEAFIAAFAVEKIKEFAQHMGEIGDQTERAAAILGTSTEDIGRLGLIAQVSGGSLDSLRTAFSQLSLRVIEQSDQTKRALDALGLSFSSLQGKSSVDQLELLADAFSHLENGANKTAIATALLGRAGAELIPFLNQGRDGIAAIAAQADALGVALDEKTTRALSETNREFTLMSAAIKGAAIQAFLPLQGAINGVVQIVTDLAQAFVEAMKSSGMVKDAMDLLSVSLKLVATALAYAVRAVRDLWAETMQDVDQIGLVWMHLGDLIRQIFTALRAGIGEFFSGLVEAARAAVGLVGTLFVDLGEVIKGAFSGNFSEAFEKLKADAAGAAVSIGSSLSRSMSGVDFSTLRGEWNGFLADMRARQDETSAALARNNRDLTKELGAIWRNGNRDIEAESDRHNKRMASPVNQDAVNAAIKAIEGQIKAEQEGLKLKIAVWDAGVKQFAMFEQTRFGLVERATQQEYEAELALLRKELELPGIKLAKQQDINNKIRELEARHNLEMIKLDNDAVASQQRAWDGYFSHIESAFNSQLRGLLSRTTTWAQAFKAIVGDLVIAFIQAVEKMAFQWIAAEIAKTTATTTGAGARAAAETAGQATGMIATITNALRSIGASLGMTFAGVSANQAPLLGPAAPAEAAAVTAAVDAAAMAFLPLEVGAWSIPSTMPALLHPGEMVVPQRFAEGLRENGGAGGGGDTHFHFPGVMDTNGFLQAIRNNSSPIARMLSAAMNKNPSLRPAY